MIKFFYRKLIVTFDSLTLLFLTNSKRKHSRFVPVPNNPFFVLAPYTKRKDIPNILSGFAPHKGCLFFSCKGRDVKMSQCKEGKLPSNISYIAQQFVFNTANTQTSLRDVKGVSGVNKRRDVSVYNKKQINNMTDITDSDVGDVSDVCPEEISKYKKVWELPVKSIVKNSQVPWPWLFTILYFVFMLIFPILSLLNTASKNLFFNFWETATEPVALSAYTVTISMAFFASIFNTFFGFILAWVLVRYNFPGKRLLDAAVDLPFALPTSVAGLTLATVYNDQGWIGSFLSSFGIQIVFTKLGILIAMIFVSFPFVVRTLQPVLQEMEIELEEAAWSLGASPWKTFQKIIFPPLIPAILTGLTLAFSRAIGEYGSIVIVSSNIPLKDLIASVLIFQNLEQYDYTRATVIGTVVLILSLILLLGINFLQSWNQKYLKF